MKIRIIPYDKDFIDFENIKSYVFEGEFLKMFSDTKVSHYRINSIEYFNVFQQDV